MNKNVSTYIYIYYSNSLSTQSVICHALAQRVQLVVYLGISPVHVTIVKSSVAAVVESGENKNTHLIIQDDWLILVKV